MLKIYDLTFKTYVISFLESLLLLIGAILIGFLLVMFAYLLVSIISKKIKSKPLKHVSKTIEIDYQEELLASYKQTFLQTASSLPITKRLTVLKDLSIALIKDTANKYYPNAKKPYLEITLKNTILLANDIAKKIDDVISEIVDSKLFKICWAAFASSFNAINFFKGIFKKDRNPNLKTNIREMKISYVLMMLEKNRNNPKDKDDTEKTYFLLNNLINEKLANVLDEVNIEAIKLYSDTIDENNLITENNHDFSN